MTGTSAEYEPPQVEEYGTVSEITLDDKCGGAEDDVGYAGLDGSIVPEGEC